MADEDEQGGADAAEAFEAMRGELALLRRAVEGLAAERVNIDVPDYSETLAHLQQGVNVTSESIVKIGQALGRSPALAMTPEDMAQRIAAAGNVARREDQAALATARKGLEEMTRQLHGYVVSRRRGDEQNRLLVFTAIGGIIAGIVLWAVFGGALARATPDSWQWPESMAARALGGSEWDGARRLATVNGTETWNAMVTGVVIGRGNQDALERCQKAANKAGGPVRCTVRIRPEERR